jgi:hypothetical protein
MMGQGGPPIPAGTELTMPLLIGLAELALKQRCFLWTYPVHHADKAQFEPAPRDLT